MNTKNFWIAASSGAAASLLLANLPYLGFVNCLLCAGFWGSAVFAVWLYRRLTGTVSVREAVKLGAVSGLRASEAAGVLRQWLEVADGTDTHLVPLVEPYVDEVDVAAKVVRVDWQRDW